MASMVFNKPAAIFLFFALWCFTGLSASHHNEHRHATPKKFFLQRKGLKLKSDTICADLVNERSDIKDRLAEIFNGVEAPGHGVYREQTGKRRLLEEELSDADNPQCPITENDILGSMSLRERALCPFRVEDDVDPMRIPHRIPFVHCACRRPTRELTKKNIPEVHCENHFLDMQVLVSSDDCATFDIQTIQVPVACVGAFGPYDTTKVGMRVVLPRQMPVES